LSVSRWEAFWNRLSAERQTEITAKAYERRIGRAPQEWELTSKVRSVAEAALE